MATTNEERIIEAAEKLEAQGVNPTQVTVREALGGGSFATIGPILKKWKESKKEDGKLAEVRVPEAITERMEQLQGAVWQAAVDEADRRLVAEREALHQAQEAAAAEVREHLDSIAALETEATEYQRKIVALEDTCNDLDASRHNAKAEAAELKERFQHEKAALTEQLLKESGLKDAAEARADRAEALHREALEQSRADLAALKNEHAEAIKKLETQHADAINFERMEAKARVNKIENKLTKYADELEKTKQAAAKYESQLEAMRRSVELLAVAEQKAEVATQEAAELRGELRALREAQETKNGD